MHHELLLGLAGYHGDVFVLNGWIFFFYFEISLFIDFFLIDL